MDHTRFQTRLRDVGKAVEDQLGRLLDDDNGAPRRMADSMRHAVLGGGKRLRPFLVVETASMFEGPPSAALSIAAALECIHCYSLVHDDLPAMDNDAIRRGRPTVWKAYDEWTAILAGDALLTLAFEIVCDPALDIAADQRVALLSTLARASGWKGMVGGQCIDLEADKLGEPSAPDEAHIRRLQAMKTGELILAGVTCGAILGGASGMERAALDGYGRDLGLAFQIADDLLDAEGDAAAMGKAAGKDAAAGKATLVSILGIPAARAELAKIHQAAIDKLRPFGDRAAMLVAVADFVVARDH